MRLFRLFRRDTAREVAGWVRDGLIERAQAEAILARYGTRLADAEGAALGYYVLTALATLFIGLALILIVSHNWDEIPRMTRMLGLIGLTLAVNLQGARLLLAGRRRPGLLWLFFGGIAYGTSIMLIAQIYHLGEHYPDGIFYWALGVLPLVFVTRSRLIGLLVLTLASVWMLVEAGSDFLPASYPLFALAALWLALWHRRSALLFLGATVGLAVWLNLLFAWAAGGGDRYDASVDQLPLTIALGLLLTGAAWWLMRRADHRLQDYGQLLHLWLLRGLIVLLLVLSFDNAWWELAHDRYRLGWFAALLPALGGAGGLYLARPSGRAAVGPLAVNALFFTAAFAAILLGRADQTVLAVASNLMLVATGVWLIRRGIDEATTHFFYTGVGVLLLTALFRYFDLIGDYIGGAVLFLVAAAVLLGAARYWRSRVRAQEGTHA
jgi:uncharacterized membrane protein